MKCPDPEWYVYVESFNDRKIKTFNVFHSHNFLNGCIKSFKKYRKPEEIKQLENEIKSWAMYSFWSKAEYEIVLTSLVNSEKHKFNDMKIDVYSQLMLNWDSFFEYAYKHKAFFLRRKTKES